jgi:hypothetical protein
MGGGKGISMPSFRTLFPRARVRYKPLDNTFEMADQTIIPTSSNEKFIAPPKYPVDAKSGDLDIAKTRDSLSTLDQPHSDGDVTEEELKTLRRVSDKIPLSAWYATRSKIFVIPLTLSTGSS